MMLAEFFDGDSRNGFLDALRDLAAGSAITGGRPFLSMSHQDQLDVLTSLDAQAFPDPATRAEPSTVAGRFFRQLKELVVSGYYTSEVGATMELHVPPFGEFRGDVPLVDVERSWA